LSRVREYEETGSGVAPGHHSDPYPGLASLRIGATLQSNLSASGEGVRRGGMRPVIGVRGLYKPWTEKKKKKHDLMCLTRYLRHEKAAGLIRLHGGGHVSVKSRFGWGGREIAWFGLGGIMVPGNLRGERGKSLPSHRFWRGSLKRAAHFAFPVEVGEPTPWWRGGGKKKGQ